MALMDYLIWNRGGWPRVDVVGEQYHSKEIRRLFPGNMPMTGMDVTRLARFVPEPSNTYDRNAVRIEVDGLLIGYLRATLASQYQPIFLAMNREGLAPVTTCEIHGYQYPADSSGTWLSRNSGEFDAQAWVVLDEPHLLRPVTAPPRVPYRELPHGSALQVRGEEAHLDVLAPLVGPPGESWVHGVLRAQEPATEKAKRGVLIEVNGSVIGDLTPASSAHFLPVIDHLAKAGQLAVAKVLLKGNRLKVEAVLHAAKAHELDASWISHVVPAAAPPLGAAAQQVAIPAKPRFVFQAPPGWPPVPAGFEPDVSWRPAPEWPTPPAGWEFWAPEEATRAGTAK